MPTIKFKKFVEDIPTPEVKTAGAAGIDLYCSKDTLVKYGENTKVPLGVGIEYPDGYMGILACRSSLPGRKGVFVSNGIGIIDSDFRHEHMIQLSAFREDVWIRKGERIAQIVLTPVLNSATDPIVVEVVDELLETEREGGFGSTGH